LFTKTGTEEPQICRQNATDCTKTHIKFQKVPQTPGKEGVRKGKIEKKNKMREGREGKREEGCKGRDKFSR